MGPRWQAPAEAFEVTQKLDGSLGILYPTSDGPAIATRGSFTGDQALHATDLLLQRYGRLPWESSSTYLFEIIYPENRIVVDYAGRDDLTLLAVVDTVTGDELPLPAWFPNHATRYDGIADLSALKGLAKDNEEGFVIRFASGLRLKVKFAEYVRLHRLVTGVTARRIWEILANGDNLDELFERVPEEFEAWVRETVLQLQNNFNHIEKGARFDFDNYMVGMRREGAGLRADFAEYAKGQKYPAILFAMYDRKPYEHMIWKMIKPKAERPFKEEI